MLTTCIAQLLLFSEYNFVLLMCCFFVKQEEITSGSWGFMSLFYRRGGGNVPKVAATSRGHQGVLCEKVFSMTKETQTSLRSLEFPLSFLLLTLLLGPELQRWSLNISPPSSQAAGFLNKANFPLHSTLVSQVLAFQQWAAGLVFLFFVFFW